VYEYVDIEWSTMFDAGANKLPRRKINFFQKLLSEVYWIRMRVIYSILCVLRDILCAVRIFLGTFFWRKSPGRTGGPGDGRDRTFAFSHEGRGFAGLPRSVSEQPSYTMARCRWCAAVNKDAPCPCMRYHTRTLLLYINIYILLLLCLCCVFMFIIHNSGRGWYA